MDSLKKEIILVSYQFCPMGGIGTRRWSKFAKYLSREGYTIHVICADYSANNSINWCSDVMNNPNIIIHRIKMKYPQFLLNPVRTFRIKLIERILKLFFFYIDFGQHSQKALKKKLTEVLNKVKTDIVITTGGPYTQFYYLSKLKDELNFRLIIDYRDPWNMILSFKGPFKSVFRKRSERMELYSIQKADKILFTNNDLKHKYQEKYPVIIEKKSTVIYNGYDKDDYSEITKVKNPISEFYNIIYLGSITDGRAEAFKLILDTIITNPDTQDFKRIKIHVYSPSIESFLKWGNSYRSVVDKYIVHHKPVSPAIAMQKLAKSNACLSINEKRFSYLIGAKTYDYMALSKPILHIAEDGELSNILNSSGQFVTNYQTENCKIALLNLISNKINISSGQYDTFEMKHITRNLIKILHNV